MVPVDLGCGGGYSQLVCHFLIALSVREQLQYINLAIRQRFDFRSSVRNRGQWCFDRVTGLAYITLHQREREARRNERPEMPHFMHCGQELFVRIGLQYVAERS